MIAEFVRNYLQTLSGISTIYIDYLPASPDKCVSIYNLPASALDMKHAYSRITLGMRARGTYQEAKAQLLVIENALHGFTGTLGTQFFTFIQALQKPYSVGRDANQRHTLAQNFLVEYYDPTAKRL